MSAKDLIDAIFAGDTLAIDTKFQEGMEAKIGEKLEDFKKEVSAELFKEEVEIEGLDAIVEAYEKLDEISKKTLGSYIKKASTQAASKSADYGFRAGRGKDATDSDLALAGKRLKGVAKAAAKLTKEDFEALQAYIAEEETLEEGLVALDELSKGKLASYIRKAAATGMNHASDASDSSNSQGERGASYRKSVKRLKGITTASKKLANEQKEQIVSILEELEDELIVDDILALDEISKDTLNRYIKSASVSASANSSLATATMVNHINNGKKEDKEASDKFSRKYAKRIAGIAKATDKLTKEQKEAVEAALEQLDEELITEATTHHDVLTKHGYKERLTGHYTHPEIKDVEVKVSEGKAVTNDKTGDGKKSHASPSKLNSYLNSLHDHNVSLK
jgi:hypothetical protein